MARDPVFQSITRDHGKVEAPWGGTQVRALWAWLLYLKRRFVMAYTCKSCGAVADAPGHLCNPCGDAEKCSFCGTPLVDPKHMCKDKLASMRYVCEGCGRVAMEENHLCKPAAIR